MAALLAGLFILAGAAALRHTSSADALWWWLFNQDPPDMQATVPSGPQRGTITVLVSVRPAGRAVLEAGAVDGAALVTVPAGSHLPRDFAGSGQPEPSGAEPAGAGWPSRLWPPWRVISVQPAIASRLDGGDPAGAVPVAIDTATLPDGDHIVRLEAIDHSRRRNRRTLEVTFTSDNTPPELMLDAAPARLRAGRVATLRLGANEPAELRASWGNDDPLPLLPSTGGASPAFLAFIVAPVNAPAGEIAVRVTGRDAAGNVTQADLPLAIEPVTVPGQALQVPPSLAALVTGPVANAEAAQLALLTQPVHPEKLWMGEFRLPLPSSFPRTTGFGDRRNYADGHVAYHAGYDVAAPLGAAVAASASGSTVFTGPLHQRGHTVIVDHGWGIYTVYAHLSQIDVQPGQPVTQGQIIGGVGSTGLSTGPHLHWEVRLRGLPVDPAAWLALSQDLP